MSQPTVHRFSDTGTAYDATQTDDKIRHGDVVLIKSAHVVGVLLLAWPTAVTVDHGELHGFKAGTTWDSLASEPPPLSYGELAALQAGVELASKIAEQHGWQWSEATAELIKGI